MMYFILTKAVYMNRSIAGYVQIELNLDEIYEGEQDLSNLNVGNQGYCIVKILMVQQSWQMQEMKRRNLIFK